MKAIEMRGKDAGELQKELEALLREQFNLRVQRATGQLTTFHKMKSVRKDIARVKTVLCEKTQRS